MVGVKVPANVGNNKSKKFRKLDRQILITSNLLSKQKRNLKRLRKSIKK